MNYLRIAVVSLLTCWLSCAELPSSAQRALDGLDADILKIKARAVKDIRKEQDAATKRGDLAGATAIKQSADDLDSEVKAATPVPPIRKDPNQFNDQARKVVGVYITSSGSAFSLRAGGRYTAGVVGWSPSGAWAVVDDATVKLIRPDGSQYLFDVQGADLYNRTDKATWRRQQ